MTPDAISGLTPSVTKRFLLPGIGFIFLLFVALVAGISLVDYQTKIREAEQRLSVLAGVAAATIESRLSENNPAALQDAINAFKNNSTIAAVAVFDNHGDMLTAFNAETLGQSAGLLSPAKRVDAIRSRTLPEEPVFLDHFGYVSGLFTAFKQQRLTGEYASAIEFGDEYLHFMRPVVVQDKLVASVYLAVPFAWRAVLGGALLSNAAFALVIAACLGLLGYWWVAKAYRKPLYALAEQLESGVPVSGEVQVPAADPILNRLGQLCRNLLEKAGDKTALIKEDNLARQQSQQIKIGKLKKEIEALQTALARTLAEKNEAESANEMKAQFLANMSHEIRTPMTAVLGMADFLWHSNDLKPEHRRSIEVMKQTSNMLISIVDDIIDFAKIEAGSFALNKTDFNCREVLNDSFQLFALEAKAKDLKYSLEIAADFPYLLFGDAGRIGQIVVNLLSNAIKFTAQGEIKMRVTAAPQPHRQLRLMCEITDTGIGVGKDKLDLLFKAFSQSDNALTRIFPGTGLGLAVTKQLVQMMGGEIGVSSQAGIGSTFWFRIDLPIGKTAVKSEQKLKNHRFNAEILVAEDYPANQMVVQRFLEDLGCQVTLVNNGLEAVKALNNKLFDLVFMDCQMPFMDGYQATREIRRLQIKNRHHKKIPVIALTAHALQEDENRCKASGMDEWVTKPFTRHDLSKTLQKWLSTELIIADQPALKTDVKTLAKASNLIDETHAINIKFFTQQFKLDNIDDLAFISSLTNAFQQNAAQLLSNLQLSIDDGDTENIRKLAHGLKSISTNVGSGSLTDLCAMMEQAGQNRNLAGLQELLDSMKQEYLRVLMELNTLCAKA
jgi:two-component system, sensor histidine kinase